MGIDKKEMIQMLRQMGRNQAAAERYRTRAKELREDLRHISMRLPQPGSVRGSGGKADSIGRQIVKREEMREEIFRNEQQAGKALAESAELERLLFDVLTAKEREVVWMRHAEGLRWEEISRTAYISRAHCFRLEAGGMEKLCRAWDRVKHFTQ